MKKYPEPVGTVIFNGGKILLCKSKKWNNKYVIPGGHIEIGDYAAVRLGTDQTT